MSDQEVNESNQVDTPASMLVPSEMILSVLIIRIAIPICVFTA
jgi:hypothetical protein